MGLLIQFSPSEEERLRAAAARAGQDVAEYIRRLVAEHLPVSETTDRITESTDRTLELLAEWDADDATDDPEELARRDQEWEDLKAQMNATRAAAGARLLFP
jgi:hypothetical protein